MKKPIAAACTALLLGASAWMPVAQAAAFSSVQPYVTDYKIGFTDGTKLVTQPVYDEFIRYSAYTVVTKAGKKGILDNKTGKEITQAVWDNVEVLNPGKIAIVQNGGWFQYLDLPTGKLSTLKFAGGHTYDWPSHGTVIAMTGQTSMLLDASGKVLIPPFAGKLSMVELTGPHASQDAEPVRYMLGSMSKQITLYDPVTFAPRFTFKNAELIPNEGGPKTAYIKVRSGGKEGLVDAFGAYALPPSYNALYFWNNGYVRVEGPKGAGLWKDGRMLAEPQFADVGNVGNDADSYTTTDKDSITYHSLSKGTAHPLKKGAQVLRDHYVLGQDTKTGLYGIVEIGGKTVVPFVYARVEGPPAAQLLVRSDGKKGLIPGWGQPMEEPQVWFDSYVTLGTYSMLSIQDGNRIGLYSDSKGFILLPQENTVVRYDSQRSRVLVQAADGSETAYGLDGKVISDAAPRDEVLSERLTTAGSLDAGFALVDRETKQPISKVYHQIYREEASKLIVAVDDKTVDLYTLQGELLTKDIQVPLEQQGFSGPPPIFPEPDGSAYMAGVKAGFDGMALVRIEDGRLQPVSDFAYAGVTVRSTPSGHKLFLLSRTDGTSEWWSLVNGTLTRLLEQVNQMITPDGLDRVFIQNGAGWDVYSPDGQRLSHGSYRELKYLAAADGKPGAIAYQDSKTGGYGLLGVDGQTLTQPVYERIMVSREVFPQLWNEAGVLPAYVFTTNQKFGYLNEAGQEVFQTAFLTKKPAIAYRPLTLQDFPSYADLLRQNPLELVAFDKPYSWPADVPSERKFYVNLALYLDLPKEAAKQEVLAELVSRGIVKDDAARKSLTDEDMFALSYYMETGQTSQLTSNQLRDWASQRGLVQERGGHSDYQDLYAECQELFFRELLLTPAGKKAAQAKPLSASALSPAQQNMLAFMVLVGGKPMDQLPLPLPREERTKAIDTLVDQYNRQAPQLLAAYLQQNP